MFHIEGKICVVSNGSYCKRLLCERLSSPSISLRWLNSAKIRKSTLSFFFYWFILIFFLRGYREEMRVREEKLVRKEEDWQDIAFIKLGLLFYSWTQIQVTIRSVWIDFVLSMVLYDEIKETRSLAIIYIFGSPISVTYIANTFQHL